MDDAVPLLVRSRQPVLDCLMLGGAPLGGLFTPVTPEQGHATVRAALEAGIRQFDNAPLYGLGYSETLMGDVLSTWPEPVTVWTKVGRVLVPRDQVRPGDPAADTGHVLYKVQSDLVPVFDLSAEAVRKVFRGCQERLRVPIAGLRVHDADTEARFRAAMAPDGAVEELVRMRERHEIRYVSVGLNDASMLVQYARAAPMGTFDNFMCAGCWNLLDQSGYDLLRVCQQRKIRVTNAGIFGSGILWGGQTLRYTQADAEAVARTARWEHLAREYALPLPAVALAFALLPDVVENVAIGCRTPDEVRANVDLLRYTVPPQLWGDAQNRGLLPAWLPLPPRA